MILEISTIDNIFLSIDNYINQVIIRDIVKINKIRIEKGVKI